MPSSEQQILRLLKMRGRQPAAVLATQMEMTAVGVRQHLAALEKRLLVQAEQVRAGVGRPKRFWRLTAAGHQEFPDSHAELTIELINATRAVFGDQGLDRLIERRGADTLAAYQTALKGLRGLGNKLAKLAELRTVEGYMAKAERQADGSFLLVENHCPICIAAATCQGFCRSELEMFQALLGSQVNVERVEHIVSGARRCAYRIARQ